MAMAMFALSLTVYEILANQEICQKFLTLKMKVKATRLEMFEYSHMDDFL